MNRLNVVAPFPDPRNWEVLAALFPGEDLSNFIRLINLLGFRPPDSYPARAASIAVKYLDLTGPTVLIGRRTGFAFCLFGHPYFEWVGQDEAELVIVPSFSKRERWWQEEGNMDKVFEFFQSLADELRINVAF